MDFGQKLTIGTLSLVALFTLSSYGPALFPLLSIATLGCIVAGFVVFPRLGMEVPLVLNPLAPSEPFADEQHARNYKNSITLNGESLPISPFPKRMTLSIALKNAFVLAGMGVGSTVYTILYLMAGKAFLHTTAFGSSLFYMEYVIGYITILMLLLSTTWLKERRILSRANIAIGTRSDVTGMGARLRTIQYQFRDARAGYRGGYSADFEKYAQDHLALVLYDSRHPDRSKPSCGFFFHRIEMNSAA
jgi:hypothetical protein